MKIHNGERVRLVIPNFFDGVAGVRDDIIAFLPTGRAQEMRQCAATIDGRPATLSVFKPVGYDRVSHPFLNARVVSG